MTGRSDCGSWIQLTNHTPSRESLRRENSDLDDSSFENWVEGRFSEVPLTTRRGRTMREDVIFDDNLCSWNDATHLFEQYLDDKDGLKHILENEEEERLFIENSHRFDENYKKKQMAKFYDVERKALEEYGEESLKTVMLTFSASPYDEKGRLLPPVDHLDSLMDKDVGSWRAVRTALGRTLSEYDWEYMRILEPHTPDSGQYATAGYAHMHVGVVVNDPDDDLEAHDFESVMNAHIQNCDTAGREAHTVENSVSVTEYDEDEDGGIGAYLTAYMGEMMDSDPRESENWFKRFLSLLWASNRRRVGFSNGANEWVREAYEEKYEEEAENENDEESASDWEYYGIEKEDAFGETEEIEVDGGRGGGYTAEVVSPVFEDVSTIWDDPPD